MINGGGLTEGQRRTLAKIEARGSTVTDWDRGRLACLRLYADLGERQRIDALVPPISTEPGVPTLLARALAEVKAQKGRSR